MTTFNTKNQAKRKYYYIAGILVLLLIIVSLAFSNFRKSENCDPISSSSDSNKLAPNEQQTAQKSNEPIEYVTIDTNSGPVKGRKSTFNNITVNTFYGIPYAKPPIGDLRFARTEPIGQWEGLRDALQQPASCLQTDSPLVLSAFRFLNSTSSEDCLYLNIWAPEQEDQFLPVMVYIHGGVFAYGGVATEELDGTALATTQNVVVVTIQYRLGIFGFLSFDGKEPKGNMGLYDQREALKWIHNNINKFGGDHDSITVIGHGAGAISAGLHMMESESKYFFQRTILQGFGLLFNKEIYSQSKKFSKKFAEDIGCFEQTNIKQCIKKLNVDKLLEVQQEILEDHPVAFGPVIPSDFVSVYPTEAMQSFEFQIDFMFGVNSEDDSLFLTAFRNNQEDDKLDAEEAAKEDKPEKTASEANDSEEKGDWTEDEHDGETHERATDKPILSVSTAPSTTTTSTTTTTTTTTAAPATETSTEASSETTSNSSEPTSKSTTIETSSTTTTTTNTTTTTTTELSANSSSSDLLEKEETPETSETEKEEKEPDAEETSEGTESEPSEADAEEESTEEERRRRKKREVDELVTNVVCPLLKFAESIVESNRTAYIYQLNEFSSYHDEIVFALGYPLKHKSLYDNDEIKFSNRVMKNWAKFATDGDITTTDDKWKSYTKESPMFLKMSISSISLEKFNRDECNLEPAAKPQ